MMERFANEGVADFADFKDLRALQRNLLMEVNGCRRDTTVARAIEVEVEALIAKETTPFESARARIYAALHTAALEGRSDPRVVVSAVQQTASIRAIEDALGTLNFSDAHGRTEVQASTAELSVRLEACIAELEELSARTLIPVPSDALTLLERAWRAGVPGVLPDRGWSALQDLSNSEDKHYADGARHLLEGKRGNVPAFVAILEEGWGSAAKREAECADQIVRGMKCSGERAMALMMSWGMGRLS
jgi:hypothetical protein